jgi:hypothetical protein
VISNQSKTVIILFLLFIVGLGVGIGGIFNANIHDPFYWLLLGSANWFAYNVIAYLRGWTMYLSGYLPPSDKFAISRLVGCIVSGALIILALFLWAKNFSGI